LSGCAGSRETIVVSSGTEQPRDVALLERAWSAAERQAWGEAFELLSTADGQSPLGGDELTLLAQAAYLSGQPEASLEAWEHLHEIGSKEHDRVAAATAAVHVANLLRDAGQEALFRGWVREAEGLLDGVPESVVHGHLAVAKAAGTFVWGDLSAALDAAREAVAAGTRLDDPAVVALGKNLEGRTLILNGDVEAGLALVDESAITVFSGTVDPMSAGVLFCSTICALHSLAEYERAEELRQGMERLGHRHAIGVFHGWCRVHTAEMQRFRGAWKDAEEEATRAYEELRPYVGLDRGWPMALLGEIRLRRGDLSGAEEAMLESYGTGWEPQPGFALLRLAEGDAEAAADSIRDALENPSRTPSRELPPNNDLRRAPLLAAHVEIALARDDVELAGTAAEELERIADAFGTKALKALDTTARGSVQLARGNAVAARSTLQEGVRLWSEIGAPYETARTRVALARALEANGNHDRAGMELRAASHTFEELGAHVDAARVTRAMGGSRAASTPKPRERRVFMFTDIVNSTDLARVIGDDAWGHLVRWHDEVLSSLTAAYGGEVVRTTGDGIFVTFANPGDALGCAVAIQGALQEHRQKNGFAPSVRIGLHAAEATREGSDWSGVGVHAAARIGALAEAEEILLSTETADVAGTAYRFSEPRDVALKGLSEPIAVVTVEWR
jgi:class 3 adenylate cyclase